MVRKCARLIARFATDRSGATAIEYALIAGVVGLGLVISLAAIAGGLNGILNTISSELK